MSNCAKRNIRSHWCSTLTVVVGCVIWWSAAPTVPAEESAPPVFIAALSVTPPPEFILERVRELPDRPVPRAITRPTPPAPVLHHKPTDAEAWERFETEYRLTSNSPLLGKHQLEIAKYGLDATVFAVDRFVKGIRDHADFEFGQNGFRHTRANSRGGFLGNPRVMLDLDMLSARPYVGARLVIPFGN